MKEIKAYIRREKAEYVISALEEAGVPGCTAVEVKAVGAAAVPEEEYLSIDYIEKVSTVTKLEIICKDEDVSRLVDVIKKIAYSGRRGDGMILVSDINYAVKIRTGETGDAVLVSHPDSKRKK